MSFKVDMTSNDVDKQLALLKYYPEVMKKHFRPRLQMATQRLKGKIEPNVPVRTGRALAALRAQVSGSGVNMTGRVGWFGKNQPWYINIVEYGAKAHRMDTFVPGLKVYIDTHPGFGGRQFMAAAYQSMQPQIETEMAAASEAVVNEMRVP